VCSSVQAWPAMLLACREYRSSRLGGQHLLAHVVLDQAAYTHQASVHQEAHLHMQQCSADIQLMC
jgi:hypothetical protein